MLFVVFLAVTIAPVVHASLQDSLDCSSLARAFVNHSFDGSNCPQESWMEVFRAIDPQPNKNMINIGFNKGYNFAMWSSLWVPSANVNVQTWYDALKELGVNDCGICNDCKLRINNEDFRTGHRRNNTRSTLSMPPTLVMVGVDLNQKNLGLIQKISERFDVQTLEKRNVHVHTILAAASDRNGKVWIPQCPHGSEVCSIAPAENVNTMSLQELRKLYQVVPMVTVDSLVEDLIKSKVLKPFRKTRRRSARSTRVDILLIDTEGNDVSVIEGATRSLRSGMVRMLIFEYHRQGQWSKTSLESVVSKLSRFKYDCYFEGQARLWKLTDCWDAAYEIRRWSNVMCLRRGNVWHQVAERRFRVHALGGAD